MKTKKTTMFYKFLKKQDRLFYRLPLSKSCTKEKQQMAAWCLTEIYFRSQNLIDLIKKISDTNPKLLEKDLDTLLSNLVDLHIELYDEMTDWFKELKKPLNTVSKGVAELIEKMENEKKTKKLKEIND